MPATRDQEANARLVAYLRDMHACKDAIEWAEREGLGARDAWLMCDDASWLVWVMDDEVHNAPTDCKELIETSLDIATEIMRMMLPGDDEALKSAFEAIVKMNDERRSGGRIDLKAEIDLKKLVEPNSMACRVDLELRWMSELEWRITPPFADVDRYARFGPLAEEIAHAFLWEALSELMTQGAKNDRVISLFGVLAALERYVEAATACAIFVEGDRWRNRLSPETRIVVRSLTCLGYQHVGMVLDLACALFQARVAKIVRSRIPTLDDLYRLMGVAVPADLIGGDAQPPPSPEDVPNPDEKFGKEAP